MNGLNMTLGALLMCVSLVTTATAKPSFKKASSVVAPKASEKASSQKVTTVKTAKEASFSVLAQRARYAAKFDGPKLQKLVNKHLSLCETQEEAQLYVSALGYAKGHGITAGPISQSHMVDMIAGKALVSDALALTEAGLVASADEGLAVAWENDSQINSQIDLDMLNDLMNGGLQYNIDDLMGFYTDPGMGAGAMIDQQMAQMDAMLAQLMQIIQDSMLHGTGFDWGALAEETVAGAIIGGAAGAAGGAVVGAMAGGVGAAPGAATGAAGGAVTGGVTGFLTNAWNQLKGDDEKDDDDDEGPTLTVDECFPPIILHDFAVGLDQNQSDFIYTLQMDYVSTLNLQSQWPG
jgi:hypothetical protein